MLAASAALITACSSSKDPASGSLAAKGRSRVDTSDCDGLTPAVPGAPSQFKLVNQDFSAGYCAPGETDGTGRIAVSWQNNYQPHDSRYTFVDPDTATVAGQFNGVRLDAIGQASGFMGGECYGALCNSDYVVLGPDGDLLYRSSFTPPATVYNDPTGGLIRVVATPDSNGLTTTFTIDAIDAAGFTRWTRALPDPLANYKQVTTGVDRQGNVLNLWPGDDRFRPGTQAGQWIDTDGNQGDVFLASDSPHAYTLSPRVGSGLFAKDYKGWSGQFEPLATDFISPPPDWLAGRPGAELHMVHGGQGYAVLPPPQFMNPCEQTIEVISPSGQTCGTASFPMGGAGWCKTTSIVVGYDGTVVQQFPRERDEATCRSAGHECDCTYQYWPGFFQ